MTLKLHHIDTPGNILREDLSGIITRPDDVRHYFAEMKQLCQKHRGVGLAANQVGVRQNFFFVALSVKLTGAPAAHICINPTWEPVEAEGSYVAKEEGCLSLPDRRFDVRRWKVVRARWTSTQGHLIERRLRMTASQVFQHEHDHLRGITLLESRIKPDATE